MRLARVPFVENAAYLLEVVELGKIQGFISATTVTDIHYLVKRHTKSVTTQAGDLGRNGFQETLVWETPEH